MHIEQLQAARKRHEEATAKRTVNGRDLLRDQAEASIKNEAPISQHQCSDYQILGCKIA